MSQESGMMTMNIDAALLLSGVAVLISLIFSFASWKRGSKQDTKNDANQMTTVIVKLENIGDGIAEIKGDLRNARNEIAELRERTAKNESAISSFHKRLDAAERNYGINFNRRKDDEHGH